MARQPVLAWTPDDNSPRMTYEGFLRWLPDGKQGEWFDGEVIGLTTSTRHMRSCGSTPAGSSAIRFPRPAWSWPRSCKKRPRQSPQPTERHKLTK